MRTYKAIQEYCEELINYGGYALPRWFVIEDLNSLCTNQKLVNIYLTGCKVLSKEDAVNLLKKENFEEHNLGNLA